MLLGCDARELYYERLLLRNMATHYPVGIGQVEHRSGAPRSI